MSDAHMWTADSRPRPAVYLTYAIGEVDISLHVDDPDDRRFDALLATFERLVGPDAERGF